MTPPPVLVTPEALLAHTGWLQALARELAGDSSLGDDLAQRTWLAALERPPLADRPLRAWLASVLQNFLRQEWRGEGRRGRREREVARPEELPSTLELVERVSTQRALSQAVLLLDEPYRTTVLLRFYEDVPPRAIAERMGVPVSTVKTRLARALASLRSELSAGGDGRSWLPALLPLLRGSKSLAPHALGGIAVSTTVKAVAAALTVAVATTAFLLYDRGPAVPDARAEETAAVVAPVPAEPPAKEQPEVAVAALDERAPVEAQSPVAVRGTPPAPAAAPAPSAPAAVRGRVVDERGAGLSGLRIGYEHERGKSGVETATSGAGGAFEIPSRASGGSLVALDDAWTTVLAGLVGANRKNAEPVLVVAPALELAGVVVDEWGTPLADAAVSILRSEELRARIDALLDYSSDVAFETRSDDLGAFELDAPLLDGAALLATAPGFTPLERPVPVFSDPNLRLVLHRPRVVEGSLTGVVLDQADEPVAGARVGHGLDVTTTDERGRFVLDLSSAESWNERAARFVGARVVPDAIVAVATGHLPGRLVAERDAAGRPQWPEHVVLRLGGPPLTLEGVVVDRDGDPLPDMQVWITDPTLLGFGQQGPLHLEAELAGAEDRFDVARTDDSGRFTVRGLTDKAYRLDAMDPGTLLRVRTEPIEPGRRNVRIELPTDAYFERIRGRVVNRAGRGIPNVTVHPMCDVQRSRFREHVVSTRHSALDSVLTDENGSFELLKVPRHLVYLRLDGETILPLEYGRSRSDGADGDDLAALLGARWEEAEIGVDERCHFRVELPEGTPANLVSVLDENGEELTINVFAGNSRRESQRVPIEGGRTPTLGVADSARTLVLYQGDVELLRVPLVLTPGEVITVTP